MVMRQFQIMNGIGPSDIHHEMSKNCFGKHRQCQWQHERRYAHGVGASQCQVGDDEEIEAVGYLSSSGFLRECLDRHMC